MPATSLSLNLHNARRLSVKTLSLLFLSFFVSLSAHAEQALVLTEIEQLQEKVWYLQRDLSTQKTALEQYQQEIKGIVTSDKESQQTLEKKLATLTELVNSQQNRTSQTESNLKGLDEALTALRDEFNQQNAVQLQQAQKTGTQEGLLQSLRDQLTATRQNTEMTLAETNKRLDEALAQILSLQQSNNKGFNQTALYLGGAALILAVLLTVGFIFLNNKSKQTTYIPEQRQNHEL
jgi:chromosome segregation ATPase